MRELWGADALDRLGPALDALHAATDAPTTARRPWLTAWCDAWPATPLLVAVGDEEHLDAAAVLAVQRRRSGTALVVPVGHGPSDEVRLPARDDDAAALLADAVVQALAALDGPWRLVLRHLPPHDAVARALEDRLPHAVLCPGDVSPRLTTAEDRQLRGYVSRNHHQQTRRLGNRLAREGALEVRHLHGPDEVAGLLPELRDVWRARDTQLGRVSGADDPSFWPFFRRVAVDLAARGELRLTSRALLQQGDDPLQRDRDPLEGVEVRRGGDRVGTPVVAPPVRGQRTPLLGRPDAFAHDVHLRGAPGPVTDERPEAGT